VKDNLPKGVQKHGINRYYGAQEVGNPLIPPPDESTDSSFVASMLHRIHCGLLRELLVYTDGRRPDAPRPIALGPSLIEGTCGRLKRIVKEQGNLRIRDFCIRAKVVAKEDHLAVDGEPGGAVEDMVKKFMTDHIEGTEDRKQCLNQLKLQVLTVQQKAVERRALFRSKRSEYFSRIPIRFDTDDKWTRLLLVQQAEARGFRSCQGMRAPYLLGKVNEWDKKQPREKLNEFLSKRGITGDYSSKVALKKLRDHDKKEPKPVSAKVLDDSAEGVDDESDESLIIR
jgi:hypothetical protein